MRRAKYSENAVLGDAHLTLPSYSPPETGRKQGLKMKTRGTPMRQLLGKTIVASMAIAIAGLLTAPLSTTASAAECNDTTSRLATILKRGKLLAGIRYDYPPNGYVDPTGQNMGFGPDMAREFAKHLGVSLEMIQTKADTRIPMNPERDHRSRHRADHPD